MMHIGCIPATRLRQVAVSPLMLQQGLPVQRPGSPLLKHCSAVSLLAEQ